MNKFSIVGKCLNITKLDSNKYIINIISNSPMHKNITIPIRISKSNYINKIITLQLLTNKKLNNIIFADTNKREDKNAKR